MNQSESNGRTFWTTAGVIIALDVIIIYALAMYAGPNLRLTK